LKEAGKTREEEEEAAAKRIMCGRGELMRWPVTVDIAIIL